MSGKANLHFGTCARNLRHTRGLSLMAVADASGGALSENLLSKLERGQARWNADTLEGLAAGLGMSLPDLLRQVAADGDDAGRVDGDDRDLADDVAKCLRDRDWHGLAFIGLFEMARAERAKGATARAVLVDVLETSKEVAAVVIEGLMDEIAARRDGEASDGDDAGR